MRWFRLYDEILDDPKMAELSDFQFRCFVNLMSMASQSEMRGELTDNRERIAWRLRIKKNVLSMAVDRLIELRILASENGKLRFINWDKRQFKSDDVTARVKRFRNVSVTPPDTDTETDTDNTTPPPPKGERAARGGFDKFWSAYPRKKSKGQAEKAFNALKPSEQLLSAILAGIERAKTSEQWRKDGGQFVPYPATWIRARGWEDEETEAVEEESSIERWKRRRMAEECEDVPI